MEPKKLLVVDLEATCWERGAHVQEQMETIEIGALLVDPLGGVPTREFQCFVRPSRFPSLSAFCTQLTSIRQEDVDAAEPFGAAFEAFVGWLGEPRGVRFASWGDYDRRQLVRDCELSGVPYPFLDDTLNLKHICCPRFGMKPGGMAQALARAGLALDGTHHRALDDARNILRIAERAFEGRLDLLMACPPSPPPELRPRPGRPGSGHAFGP